MSDYTPKKMDVEHAYIAQTMRSDQSRFSEATKEFRRFLAEFEQAAAEKAWDEGAQHVASTKCKYRTNDGDPCPENPYRLEGTE